MKYTYHLKPKERGAIRLFFGRNYFTFKRYALWFFAGIKFARQDSIVLSYKYFFHRTPLLRKLKDMDMYLQYNKIANLKIAVSKVNNITIKPGETFSYWKIIGRPTKSKGYQDGIILKNGKVRAGIGGGLCQLSNLIYWMAIHTPLTVVERHRHGYDVFADVNRTQPFGSGATCFYNYGDLMLRNDTTQIFQLNLEVTDMYLEGAWMTNEQPRFSYEVYEKEHIMQLESWGGYSRHNLLHRKKIDLNTLIVDDEYVVENHAIMMYSPFLPCLKNS